MKLAVARWVIRNGRPRFLTLHIIIGISDDGAGIFFRPHRPNATH